MAMAGLEHKYQFTPWTSEVAKTIGRAMPDSSGPLQSPLRIQHAIRAYTGTVGLYTLNAGDWALRQVAGKDIPERPSRKWYEKPVLSRVIKGESEFSRHNKYTERLYKAIDDSNKAFRTINNEIKSYRKDEAKELLGKRKELLSARPTLSKLQKAMREISAAQRAISLHPTMDADVKRDKMDKLNKKRNQLLDRAAPLLDQLQFDD